jgi:hypothetical protein
LRADELDQVGACERRALDARRRVREARPIERGARGSAARRARPRGGGAVQPQPAHIRAPLLL